MPTTELDSFKWIGHSSPKQWQQVSADQSSGRPCRSDEPQAALSICVENVVLHDTKSIRALENSEMGSLSSDTWFGVRCISITSRRRLNLESWRYYHCHMSRPSIDNHLLLFHQLLWRLLSFKTLPLTSICGRHGGMINGKKTSSILYVIQVPTEKVRQYNLYKVVLSVLQSVFDPNEILSESSSSKGSAKVCYQWFPYNQDITRTFLRFFCCLRVCRRHRCSRCWCRWCRCSRPRWHHDCYRRWVYLITCHRASIECWW